MALSPLSSGSLGIFAPASPFQPDQFERGAQRLEAVGLHLTRPEAIYAQTGFLAGDDEHRAQAFHELLDDPEVEALIAARGGYGVHRLLEMIDYDLVCRSRKPIVGFSDITALHLAIWTHSKQPALHGPVVTQLGDLSSDQTTHLYEMLKDPLRERTYEADRRIISSGRATGPLLGGCLSVIATMVGSPFCPDFDGAILLLEDVGEAPYRIDRLLTGLRLSGILNRIAGVALGDFVRCRSPNPAHPPVEDVLEERLKDLGVPVLSGLPFGHGDRNLTVPVGISAVLDADARTLTVGA